MPVKDRTLLWHQASNTVFMASYLQIRSIKPSIINTIMRKAEHLSHIRQ